MKKYLYGLLLLGYGYIHGQEAGVSPEGIQDQPAAVAEQAAVEASPEAWQFAPGVAVPDNPFRGNWYKKRDIVRAGRVLYEEIHGIVALTWEPLFEQFITTHTTQLSSMKERLRLLSVDMSELEWVMAHVQELTIRSPATVQSGEVAEYIVILSEEEVRKELTTLSEEVDLAQKRYKDFENGVDIARQRSGLGSSYEQQAWKYYADMDAAYDDRAAQVLLQKMTAQRDHLQELMRYISQQLTPYCVEVAQLFDAHMLKATVLRDSLLKAHVPLTRNAFQMQKELEKAEKKLAAIPSKGVLIRAGKLLAQPFILLHSGLQYGVHSVASLFGYKRGL